MRAEGRWIAVTLVTMAAGYTTLRLTSWDVPVAVTFTLVLVLVGVRSGLSWEELGLAAGTRARGARWALVSVLVVTAGYVVIALSPAASSLQDSRYQGDWATTLLTALVIVPLGTVLWEEVAFRGVLWAQLRRRWSTHGATLATSVLFGIWHALPALRFSEANDVVDDLSSAGPVADGDLVATSVTVMATVVVTFFAGLLLCELRRRSGSLLAPIGLHWATNGVGVIAVALVG